MHFFKEKGAFIFFLLLALHCLFIFLDVETLRIITKMLLTPVLFTWLRAHKGGKVPAVVNIALLFSFLGDVLLIRDNQLFFMLGMLSFIIAHICYSIYFARLQDPRNSRLREAVAAAVILILLSAVVFVVVNPYLGSLRIPVLIYMAVISTMAILASNTASNQSLQHLAMRFFIPGAALFVASDTILALNKFVTHLPLLDIVVMATYGGAQYLLVKGFKMV